MNLWGSGFRSSCFANLSILIEQVWLYNKIPVVEGFCRSRILCVWISLFLVREQPEPFTVLNTTNVTISLPPVSPGFFKILLTHEGSHREVYRDFQPSLTFSAGGAKGCSDHRFRAPPPNCQLYINTESTTSIGRLIKSSRLYGIAAAPRQHLNSRPSKY